MMQTIYKLLNSINPIRGPSRRPDPFAQLVIDRAKQIEDRLIEQAKAMAVKNGVDANLAVRLTLALHQVRKDGLAIDNIPPELRIEKVCLAAVNQNIKAFTHLSAKQRTPVVCLAAVQQNPALIEFIEPSLRTQDICLAAVQQDESVLQHLDPSDRTPAVIMAALQTAEKNQNIDVCKYIRMSDITSEVASYLISNFNVLRSLTIIPENLLTTAMCEQAILKNPLAIGAIPKTHQTPQLRMTAVMTGPPETLSHIDKKDHTPDLCLQAMLKSSSAIKYVTAALRTLDLRTLAVERDPSSLKLLPPNERDKDICWTAVSLNGMTLEHVPDNINSPELRMLALGQPGCGAAIKYINSETLTQEECLTALRNSNFERHIINHGELGVTQWIPTEMRTPDVCKAALTYERDNAFRCLSDDQVKIGQQDDVSRLRSQLMPKQTQREQDSTRY